MKILALSVLIMIGASFPVQANSLYLQDFANVISTKKAVLIQKQLADIEKKYHVLVHEVIIPHNAGQTDEQIANGFLKQLTEASPAVEKKILVLIVLETQKVVLYCTPNLATQLTPSVKNQINASISAYIPEKKYDEMATVGITKLQKAVNSAPQNPQKITLNILFFLVALGAVVAMIKLRKPRRP